MRRRPVEPSSDVPAKLRRFTASDWDPDPQLALMAWSRARMNYWRAHPDAWPDVIAVLAGRANARARRLGRRVPYPEYDEGRTTL